MGTIKDLATLAWERCEHDINMLVMLVLGGAAFVIVFFSFWMFRVAQLHAAGWGNLPDINIASTQLAMVLVGARFAFFDSIYWIIVAFIIICIFEYLLSLFTLLYYYDNCNWSFINMHKKWLQEANVKRIAAIEQQAYQKQKRIDYFIAEVEKIKKYNAPVTKPHKPKKKAPAKVAQKKPDAKKSEPKKE